MDEHAPVPSPEATCDTLLDGRLVFWQGARGYRAGLDAALLAAACDAPAGARVLEVGCGAGGALLAAAWRRPETRFTGLERDRVPLLLARRNIAENGLSERVEAVEGDVARGFKVLGLAPFDAAMANPPFFDDPATLRTPSPEKRGAWMAEDGLAAWCDFLMRAVRDGGRVTVIHRADRLADLLMGLGARGGSFQVRPIHAFPDAPAKRVLIRAVRLGKAPLLVLPPLVLHQRDGAAKHTSEAEAILRGTAAIAWR
ncbi:tRNA1(Val) (adenine(37)-N6)-methyltransferase [Phenylobacterium sp.]|uniref:tRNA1(Val) (adenine(37)-N6)-methyltransferase n=1 Tax=Phenylobacterium sp. TaxID=1871053 RepID=UPI002FD90734